MASAYRNASRLSDESDSDMSEGDLNGSLDLSGDSEDETSNVEEVDEMELEDNEEEDEEEDNTSADEDEDTTSRKPNTNKNNISQLPLELRNRILMLTSRGVSHRQRHLLNDLSSLLPHTYKDTKLDTKSNNNYNSSLNALADLHSCNYVFFLEARKHAQDLYLWLAAAPNGPTIKFSVTNIHTMAELGFEGNCLKGGRGVVVFDKGFDQGLMKKGGVDGSGNGETQGFEHRSLIKEMLKGIFCVPAKGVRGMKPFVDRVIGIYALDGKIWIRVYEIRETETQDDKSKGSSSSSSSSSSKSKRDIKLLEVGPRMVLTPIVILEGSFGGPVIYENKQYVSGNQLRKEALLKKSNKYAERRTGVEERMIKRKSLGLNTGAPPRRNRGGRVDDREVFG